MGKNNRENKLSLEETSNTIYVEYPGFVLVYENIHSPDLYAKSVLRNRDPNKIYCNESLIYQRMEDR